MSLSSGSAAGQPFADRQAGGITCPGGGDVALNRLKITGFSQRPTEEILNEGSRIARREALEDGEGLRIGVARRGVVVLVDGLFAEKGERQRAFAVVLGHRHGLLRCRASAGQVSEVARQLGARKVEHEVAWIDRGGLIVEREHIGRRGLAVRPHLLAQVGQHTCRSRLGRGRGVRGSQLGGHERLDDRPGADAIAVGEPLQRRRHVRRRLPRRRLSLRVVGFYVGLGGDVALTDLSGQLGIVRSSGRELRTGLARIPLRRCRRRAGRPQPGLQRRDKLRLAIIGELPFSD